MIKIDNISFSYGINGFFLDKVSFSIKEGEFAAIIGPNGSGKTTLIKIAAGILGGYGGTVEAGGKNIKHLSDAARAALISYVPQIDSHVFDFTVEEIVMMGRRPHMGPAGLPGNRDRHITEYALSRFGLGHKKNRLYGSLSGGEKRMALIARAVAQEAPVILMDEPTSFLDIHHQAELMESSLDLIKEGKSVVMILHSVNLASEYCGRIIALKDGKVAADGTPDSILTAANIAGIYGQGLSVDKSPVSGKPNVFFNKEQKQEEIK